MGGGGSLLQLLLTFHCAIFAFFFFFFLFRVFRVIFGWVFSPFSWGRGGGHFVCLRLFYFIFITKTKHLKLKSILLKHMSCSIMNFSIDVTDCVLVNEDFLFLLLLFRINFLLSKRWQGLCHLRKILFGNKKLTI